MRISDWSSDVCSSDLTPVRSPVLRRSAGLSPCWPWSKPPHPDSPTYHCARAARSSVFCFSPCPVSDVRLHSTAAAADVPACLHHLGSIATLIADPVLVLLHRSEEHTSELQSLMRISYAV